VGEKRQKDKGTGLAAAGVGSGEIWEDGTGQRWIGGEDTTVVAVPGVLKYLDVELAAMGIKLRYNIEP
jgi:DNA-directed RNA polymerase I subunit RPA2